MTEDDPRRRLRTLLLLAWPIVLARATQAVVGFCDALMTAPLGDAALAATTTGAVNTYSLVVLPMGTVLIVQSFAAQLAGRGDRLAARRFAWYGLALALAAQLVICAGLPFVGDALALFDFAPEVHDLQRDYLVIRFTSVAAIVGIEALGNWFSGLGNTRLQMIAGLIAMVANVALNWVLIYGHLGAPAMGVSGAALASSIATWIGFAFLAWAFHRTRREAGAARLHLAWRELGRMLRFGLPHGVNWFLEFAAFTFFINWVMGSLGTVALAALNVVIQVNSVAFMPAFGVASAGAILVGQAVGAGRRDVVPAIVKTTVGVGVVWMAFMSVLYIAAPRRVMGWFIAGGDVDGPALLAAGATILALSSAWQIFDGIAMTVSESLRACGDTVWCLRARIVLAWFLFLPAAWFLVIHEGGGIPAAMGCLVGYLVVLAAAMVWRFRSGAWRKIELIEPPVVP